MAATVNASTTFQEIDGFGADSIFSYSGGYSTAVADFLFRSDTGIGLSILRTGLWLDGTTTQGWVEYFTPMDSTGANVEGNFNNELQAYNRGVRKFLFTCGAPTINGAWPWLSGGSQNGSLLLAHYADMATTLTTYMTNARAAGLTSARFYVSMMNEPDITPSYPQTAWTTTQALAFMDNNLGAAVATWAATNPSALTPQIVFGETSLWANFATWVNAAEADSTAKGYITQYATHQYGSGGPVSAPPSPISHPIWQTECFNQNDAYDSGMTDAMDVMGYINAALTTGNASAWLYFLAEDVSDNNNSGLTGTNASNFGNPVLSLADWNAPTFPKRAYCMGNFSKFVRPGSIRIAATGAPAGVDILAFTMNLNLIVVCINTNASSTAITVNLSHISAQTVTPWVTDATHNLVQQANIAAASGSFSTTLSATSVTTFVSLPNNSPAYGSD